MPQPRSIKRCLLMGALLGARCALADPSYYLVTVYDNEGETTLDFRYWTVESKHRRQIVWPEVGVGHGVTSRWYTEVFASAIGPDFWQTRAEALHWQNDYLLTQGQYPFDLALHSKLQFNHDAADGTMLQWGPVLQTEVGRLQLNGNVFFDRTFQAASPVPAEMKYQWQAKYHWRPGLQVGLQGFGELGPWDQWLPASRQSHRVGPVLTGSLSLGRKESLRYSVAYLVGKSYGQQGQMVSVRLQYAF